MPAPSLPLLCPIYGGPMRIIAFITHSADIGQILDHIGVGSEPPNIASAHGPPLSPLSPLWAGCGAHSAEGSQVESDWSSDWDLAAQAAPDDEDNQRIHWLGRKKQRCMCAAGQGCACGGHKPPWPAETRPLGRCEP